MIRKIAKSGYEDRMLTAAVFLPLRLRHHGDAGLVRACELFKSQEDPLGDRLEELQSNAMVAAARDAAAAHRRRLRQRLHLRREPRPGGDGLDARTPRRS